MVIYNYSFKVNAGEDQHLCVDYTTLNASGPLGNELIGDNWTGEWTTALGGAANYLYRETSAYNTELVRTTPVTGLGNTTNELLWHVKYKEDALPEGVKNKNDLTCDATDTVRITYYVAPDAELSSIPLTASGCTPFDVQFVNLTPVTSVYDSLDVTYEWNFGNIVKFITTDHDTIIPQTFLNDADYDSTLTIWLQTSILIPGNERCYNKDSMDVTIFAVPRAKFSASPLLQQQPSVTVNLYADSVANASYDWNFGDTYGVVWDDNSLYQKTLTHAYDNYGDYTIKLRVKNAHCEASDSVSITIIPAEPQSTIRSAGYKGCDPYLHELIEGVAYADSLLMIRSHSLVSNISLMVETALTTLRRLVDTTCVNMLTDLVTMVLNTCVLIQ